MVIAAPAGKTTVWTKPEDLMVNTDAPSESLFGSDQDSFWCSFCDVSVGLVPRSIADRTLKAMLSIDGKESITPLPQWVLSLPKQRHDDFTVQQVIWAIERVHDHGFVGDPKCVEQCGTDVGGTPGSTHGIGPDAVSLTNDPPASNAGTSEQSRVRMSPIIATGNRLTGQDRHLD